MASLTCLSRTLAPPTTPPVQRARWACQRAYRISYGAKGNGGGFSSVTFLNYIHYDWSKTRSFPMDWNESEGTFVFSIPAEHLTGKPEAQQLQQLRLGSLRRSDRAKNTRKTREAISMTQ